MKNILTAFLLILYSTVSAQEMKGMKMPKKKVISRQRLFILVPCIRKYNLVNLEIAQNAV